MKAMRFLRSMKFGLLLLALIILCSLAGSLIPQNQPAAFYPQVYGRVGRWFVSLQLHRVFSSPYFIALTALLCLNLLLCSVLRVRSVWLQTRTLEKIVLRNPVLPYSQTKEAFEQHLHQHGFVRKKQGNHFYYRKNLLGYWGSFLTHLSLLLIIVFGGLSMALSSAQDLFVLPGESTVLQNGATLHVDSFRITDDEGEADYRSTIRVRDAVGRMSRPAELSVNYPFSYAGYTFYQQSYAMAGAATITYNGMSQFVPLTETTFISPNNYNGYYYDGMVEGPQQLLYRMVRLENEQKSGEVVRAGDTLHIDGMEMKLEPPFAYPGIRVKSSPPLLLPLLYTSFGLMVAALYLTFFHTPSILSLREDGYSVLSPKPELLEGILPSQGGSEQSC